MQTQKILLVDDYPAVLESFTDFSVTTVLSLRQQPLALARFRSCGRTPSIWLSSTGGFRT